MLSWEHLADNAFRVDVATLYNAGPAAVKKKAKASAKDDSLNPATLGANLYAQKPLSRGESSLSALQSLPDVESRWKAQKDLVKHDGNPHGNIIIADDILIAICSIPNDVNSSGDKALSESLARTLSKWQLVL